MGSQYSVPSAERVARRAVVLTSIGNRGLIEHESGELETPEDSRLATLDWLKKSGSDDELEPDEWKVLQRPVGKLERQETINSVWRLEGLGVLLWALGRYELPPYDELVTPSELFNRMEIFDPDAAQRTIAEASLRPTGELEAYWNHATMAHWRFQNFFLHPGPVDFVLFSQECWIGTFDITKFRIANKDVIVGDDEISRADLASVGVCRSIAQERHRAINWLSGDAEIYSETDTST